MGGQRPLFVRFLGLYAGAYGSRAHAGSESGEREARTGVPLCLPGLRSRDACGWGASPPRDSSVFVFIQVFMNVFVVGATYLIKGTQ